MYRKEDWPYDAAANKANVPQHLEVAKKKVGVEGAIVEKVSVWDLVKGLDPIEQARGQLRSRFSKMACVRFEQTYIKVQIFCEPKLKKDLYKEGSVKEVETTRQEEELLLWVSQTGNRFRCIHPLEPRP